MKRSRLFILAFIAAAITLIVQPNTGYAKIKTIDSPGIAYCLPVTISPLFTSDLEVTISSCAMCTGEVWFLTPNDDNRYASYKRKTQSNDDKRLVDYMIAYSLRDTYSPSTNRIV